MVIVNTVFKLESCVIMDILAWFFYLYAIKNCLLLPYFDKITQISVKVVRFSKSPYEVKMKAKKAIFANFSIFEGKLVVYLNLDLMVRPDKNK